MSLLQEEDNSKIDYKNLLFLLGILWIGYNFFDKNEEYYLGEQLTTIQIKMINAPEREEVSKGRDRYSIRAENYRCLFWLSEGAFSIVRNNEEIEKKVLAIKDDEIITAKIRLTDERYVNDMSAKVRIMDLATAQQNLVQANEVEQKDRKRYRIKFYFPIAMLILGVILKIRTWTKRKESNDTQSL